MSILIYDLSRKNGILGKYLDVSHTLFILYLESNHTLFGEKLYSICKFSSGNTVIDYSIRLLFQHRRPCSTREKSRTRIQYPTLVIDPRRSFKCMSPINSSTHYPVFKTVRLHCQTPTRTHCVPCREAVCTIFMMVFGMTQPEHKPATYCIRGRHANH